MSEINGINVTEIKNFKESVKKDPSQADRDPIMVVKWTGGDGAEVEYNGIKSNFGGEKHLNAMQMQLASLAACDIEVIAVHSALLGLKINNLSIEVKGHFNVQSFLGIENTPGSGYDSMELVVHLDAPGIMPDQVQYLIERLEKSSPVGDTLNRQIPIKLEFRK